MIPLQPELNLLLPQDSTWLSAKVTQTQRHEDARSHCWAMQKGNTIVNLLLAYIIIIVSDINEGKRKIIWKTQKVVKLL